MQVLIPSQIQQWRLRLRYQGGLVIHKNTSIAEQAEEVHKANVQKVALSSSIFLTPFHKMPKTSYGKILYYGVPIVDLEHVISAGIFSNRDLRFICDYSILMTK